MDTQKVKYEYNSSVIGQRIRKLREKQKLTQAELAEKVEKSTTTIGSIESGYGQNGRPYTPSIELMAKIAIALNTSVDDLIGLNSNKDTSALTDQQKFDIIKDFITLVNPEFELQPYTVEETEIDFSSGYPDTYETTHYKSSLIINSEILTIYLSEYYDCINPGISTDKVATKEKILRLLLDDFNNKMAEAVSFNGKELILNKGYSTLKANIINDYSDITDDESDEETVPF